MKAKKLSGIFPAAFTPFTPEGEVDYDRIEPYYRMLRKNDIPGIFLNGSSGEAYSLTFDERKKLLEAWIDVKNEDFKVLSHVSDLCFPNARKLAKHAQDWGADGISTMGTLYFKANTVEKLVENCRSIAAAAPETPYYYYHIPGMSGVTFTMRD